LHMSSLFQDLVFLADEENSSIHHWSYHATSLW
jgi:hypothetical protein